MRRVRCVSWPSEATSNFREIVAFLPGRPESARMQRPDPGGSFLGVLCLPRRSCWHHAAASGTCVRAQPDTRAWAGAPVRTHAALVGDVSATDERVMQLDAHVVKLVAYKFGPCIHQCLILGAPACTNARTPKSFGQRQARLDRHPSLGAALPCAEAGTCRSATIDHCHTN